MPVKFNPFTGTLYIQPRVPEGFNITLKDLSKPPAGKCKTTNIYVDQTIERTIVEYDDEPVK